MSEDVPDRHLRRRIKARDSVGRGGVLQGGGQERAFQTATRDLRGEEAGPMGHSRAGIGACLDFPGDSKEARAAGAEPVRGGEGRGTAGPMTAGGRGILPAGQCLALAGAPSGLVGWVRSHGNPP